MVSQHPAATNFYVQTARLLHQRMCVVSQVFPRPPDEQHLRFEKGAAYEQLVRNVLRDALPSRFGVGYGHIDYGTAGPEGTNPLDVIVFDELNYGAVYREGDFVVVPSDAVLAVIEVKATLDTTVFRTATEQLANALSRAELLPEGWPDMKEGDLTWGQGFILGFQCKEETTWDRLGSGPEQELTGLVRGYVSIAEDVSRTRHREWRSHSGGRGFAYWYWSLLHAIYETAVLPQDDSNKPIRAPIPAGYEDTTVPFEEGIS